MNSIKKPNSIIFLHGALGTKKQFEPLLPAFEPPLQVYAFDFEGHGAEPPTNRAFAIEHFAENLHLFIMERDLNDVHLVGYSMGGYVALYYAATNPKRVQSVYTLATKFDWRPETAERETQLLDPAVLREKSPAFVQRLEQYHSIAGWENVVRNTKNLMLTLGEGAPLPSAALQALQCPVRLVLGDRDSMVSLEETLQIRKYIQHCELEMMPATSHPLEKVAPERFTFSVHTFVQSHSTLSTGKS